MVLPEYHLSFLQLLRHREIEADHERFLRISCKVAQKIVLQPTTSFCPVWKRESQKHVCIGLDRRIYFDNHQQCYFNDGAEGKPHLLYALSSGHRRNTPSLKIWAVLLYHDHIRRHPCTHEEKEVCLMVLTADGYLKVLNADTGAVLKSVFLSSAIDNQYRYLSWANYLYTVQVKTVQTVWRPPPARMASQGLGSSGNPFTRLLTIAVFNILPLELLTCFSVDRHIFGEDIKDASVREDRLVVYHQKGSVFRIYSLYQVIANSTVSGAKLGRRLDLDGFRSGIVGDPDFGIPVAKIKECPPVLFEAKSRPDLGVSFGGVPSVYLHNGAPNKKSVFHLRSLQNQQLARLISELSTDISALHPDVAEFHFDDYQRVIHISGCTLSCYRLQLSECRKQQDLVRLYSIDFKRLIKRDSARSVLRTSSGRTVRKRFSLEEEDLYTSAIQDVDYENELELLYAVVTLSDPSREGNLEASLYFINDKTGDLLKKIPLPTWKADLGNSIYYELNCIIHLVQDGSSSTCNYYRLCRDSNDTGDDKSTIVGSDGASGTSMGYYGT